MLDEGIYYNMKDNSRVGFQFTSAQNPTENEFIETMTSLMNASFVKEIDLDKPSLQETYASWSKYVLGETFVKSFTFKVTFNSDNLDQFIEELESLLPTLAVVPREFLLPHEYSIGPWTYLTDETIPDTDNSFVAYKNGRHARRLFLNDNQAVVTFYKKEINSLKEIIENEKFIEAIIFGDRLSFIFKDKTPFHPSAYIPQKYPLFKIKSTPALENINFETKLSVPNNTEIENINALKKSQLVRYAVPIWLNKLPINLFAPESLKAKYIKNKYIIIDNTIINELLIAFDMDYPGIAADAEIRKIAQQTQGQIIGHLSGMYQVFYGSISSKEESNALKSQIENFPNVNFVSRNHLMD